jgi:phosphatidylinositol alpha-1,6-mannosyltransferase
VTRHLLVTNDFPPKVGGIQNYLWELWRRLPPDDVVVHTTPYAGTDAFDADQPFTVIRSTEPWLLPGPHLVRRVHRLAKRHDVDLVVIDPALPAGLIGPQLDLPYAVVVHGAELAIPARLPVLRALLRRVLESSRGVIAAGGYPAVECERALGRPLDAFVIPPGVDPDRFRPASDEERIRSRRRLGLQPDVSTVVSVSRLVPRKGMDTLARAAAILAAEGRDLQVVIAGDGRDRGRLRRITTRIGAPVRFLGRLGDDDVSALVGCADVFAMLCRTRWRGLEQEGFGIVFLEAAAAGVPQVAGLSGGAHEAVSDGETGVVLDPATPDAAARAIANLLDDREVRSRMGAAARQRAATVFSYDLLADQLRLAIEEMAR